MAAKNAGQLELGTFYQIRIPFDLSELPSKANRQGWIIGRRPDSLDDMQTAYGEVMYETIVEDCCSRNAKHVIRERRKSYRIDLFGGPRLAEFVCDSFQVVVVVTRKFQKLLSRGPFAGIRAVPAKVEPNQSEVANPDLLVWESCANPCLRKKRLEVPEDSKCPFCGWGPLVCPECGEVTTCCPHCFNSLFVRASKHGGKDDLRFPVPDDRFGVPVVEAKLWDGSDYLEGWGQGLVTRRLAEWLRKRGAGPVMCIPAFVSTAGCTPEQLNRLAVARDTIG